MLFFGGESEGERGKKGGQKSVLSGGDRYNNAINSRNNNNNNNNE